MKPPPNRDEMLAAIRAQQPDLYVVAQYGKSDYTVFHRASDGTNWRKRTSAIYDGPDGDPRQCYPHELTIVIFTEAP